MPWLCRRIDLHDKLRAYRRNGVQEYKGYADAGSKKPPPRMKKRHKDIFAALCQHSHFLRSALALAADRHEQLHRTLHRLGHSEMPTGDEAFRDMQMETAKEIGGIRTMMYLDAPQETMKYHFGPLQMALCLLDAIVARYRKLARDQPVFQDDEFDIWCNERPDLLQRLKATRGLAAP